jgi:hypothetical protein
MARKGDAIYKRGCAWRLDFTHEGKRHVVSLGRRITFAAAKDIAVAKRAAILRASSGSRDVGKTFPSLMLWKNS